MKEKKTSKKIEEAGKKASATAKKLGKKAENASKVAAKKFDEVSEKVSDVAEELGERFEEGAEKTKKAATGVTKWWKRSSTTEKVTTILGIILLICSLWVLSSMILGILLLLFGILCVTGYFDEYIDDICNKFTDKPSKKK